jgi:hypothetical protein
MTGLRQGELLGLRWIDLDMRALKVRVRQAYVRGEFKPPKSRRGTRGVPLAERLVEAIEHLAETSNFRDDDDLVFGHPVTGDPLNRSNVRKRFQKACRLHPAWRLTCSPDSPRRRPARRSPTVLPVPQDYPRAIFEPWPRTDDPRSSIALLREAHSAARAAGCCSQAKALARPVLHYKMRSSWWAPNQALCWLMRSRAVASRGSP